MQRHDFVQEFGVRDARIGLLPMLWLTQQVRFHVWRILKGFFHQKGGGL